MKSFNQITILGNVCNDVDVKTVGNDNVKVARFTVATSEGGYRTQSGKEVPEVTQFHRVICWRGLSQVAEKLISKGDSVFVVGKLQYNEVDAKDGNGKIRFADIVADDISLVHKKGEGQQAAQPMAQPQAAQAVPNFGGAPIPGTYPAQPQMMPTQQQIQYDQATGKPIYMGADGQWHFVQ